MDTLTRQGLRFNDSYRNSILGDVSKIKPSIRAKDARSHQNKENKGARTGFVQFDSNIVEIKSWSPDVSKISKVGDIEQILTPEDDVKRRLLAGRTPFQSRMISTIKENNDGEVVYNYELSGKNKNAGGTSLDLYLAFSPSSTVNKSVAASSQIEISTNGSLAGSIQSLACSTSNTRFISSRNHTALVSPSSDGSAVSQERGRPMAGALDTISNSKPVRRATSEPPSSRPISMPYDSDSRYFTKPKLSLFDGQDISPSESLTDSNASVSRFRPASMILETFASDINTEYNFDRGLTFEANSGSSSLGRTPYIVKPRDLTRHVVGAELSSSMPESRLLLSSRSLFSAAPTDQVQSGEVGIAYAADTLSADVGDHLRSRQGYEMDNALCVDAIRTQPRVVGANVASRRLVPYTRADETFGPLGEMHNLRLPWAPPQSDCVVAEGWDSPVNRVSKQLQLHCCQGLSKQENLGVDGVSLLRPPLVSRKQSHHRQRSISCDSVLSYRHRDATVTHKALEPGPEQSEHTAGLTFRHMPESPPLSQLVPVFVAGEAAVSSDIHSVTAFPAPVSVPSMRVMHTSPLQALKGDANVPRVDWKQRQQQSTRFASPPRIAQTTRTAQVSQVSASYVTQQWTSAVARSCNVTPSDSNSDGMSVPAFEDIPDVDDDDDSSCVRGLGLDEILAQQPSSARVEATAVLQSSAISPPARTTNYYSTTRPAISSDRTGSGGATGFDERAPHSAKRVLIEDADDTLSDQFPTFAEAQHQQVARESRNSVIFDVGYISSDDENEVQEAEAPEAGVQRSGSTRLAQIVPVDTVDFQQSTDDEALADGHDCVDGLGALGDSGIISAATTMTIEASNRSYTKSPRLVMATRSKRAEDMKELIFCTVPGGFTTVVLRFANRRSAALSMDCRAVFVRLDEFTATGCLVASPPGPVASDSAEVREQERKTNPASSPIRVHGSRKDADKNHTEEITGDYSQAVFDVSPRRVNIAPGAETAFYVTFSPSDVKGIYSGALKIKSGHKSYVILLRGEAFPTRLFHCNLSSLPSAPTAPLSDDANDSKQELNRDGAKSARTSEQAPVVPRLQFAADIHQQLGAATFAIAPHVAIVAPTGSSPYSVAVDHLSLRHKWLKEWVLKYKDDAAGHTGDGGSHRNISLLPSSLVLHINRDSGEVQCPPPSPLSSDQVEGARTEGKLFVRNFAGMGSVVTVATSSPQLRVFCDGAEVSTFFLRSYGDERLSVIFDGNVPIGPERETLLGCAKTPTSPSTHRVEYLILICEDGEENIIEVRIKETKGENGTRPTTSGAINRLTPTPVLSCPRTTSVLTKVPPPSQYLQLQPTANSILSDVSAGADEVADATFALATLQHDVRGSAFYADEVDFPAYSVADTDISLGSYSRQTQAPMCHQSHRDFETQTMESPRGRVVVATQTSGPAAPYPTMALTADTDTSVVGDGDRSVRSLFQQPTSSILGDVMRRFASGYGAECDRSSLATYRQQRQQQTSFAASESRSHKNGVYFRKSWVDFGNVTIGNMTRLKIELCNATEKAVTVFVGDPALPFVLLHNEVRLRPRCFVCLPVRFVPVVGPKSFSSEIFMQTDDGKFQSQLTLYGVSC